MGQYMDIVYQCDCFGPGATVISYAYLREAELGNGEVGVDRYIRIEDVFVRSSGRPALPDIT